jgi:hypothetical protein
MELIHIQKNLTSADKWVIQRITGYSMQYICQVIRGERNNLKVIKAATTILKDREVSILKIKQEIGSHD